MSDEFRIYIAILADYNAGVLTGAWIDCDGKSADDLQTEINAILRTSKFPNVFVDVDGASVPSAEEFAIHDSEGFYGLIGEYTSLSDVALAAELIAEHGEAYARYAENVGGSDLPSAEDFADHYQGEFASLEAYAEGYIEETGMLESLAENLRCYFDVERFARDLELNGDINAVRLSNGHVAIFHNF